MTTTPYTYSVIRYRHDPAAGETLNIGVILCAPEAMFFDVCFEYHYERLSEPFANFDGEHYRQTLRRFTTVLDDLRDRLSPSVLFELVDPATDAAGVGRMIWPDRDLSFQLGPVLAGISDDPRGALDVLFHRPGPGVQPPKWRLAAPRSSSQRSASRCECRYLVSHGRCLELAASSFICPGRVTATS